MFSNKNQMHSGICVGLTYLVAYFFKPMVFLEVSVRRLTSGWCTVIIDNTYKKYKSQINEMFQSQQA